MSKALEALKQMSAYHLEMGIAVKDLPNYEIIEKDLILLNALRNNINRKVETTEYQHAASNSYRITTLLTYELKEQWDEKELEALTQFLLNLSGISKKLKALEIIKETPIFAYYITIYKDAYEMVSDAKGFRVNNSVEELQKMFDLLKEVLL